VLALVGVIAAAGALVWLARDSALPGDDGPTPRAWPRASALELARDRPTLAVFVHPRCPCSRATIANLARLSDQLQNKALIEVVAEVPAAVADDSAWSQSSTIAAAEHIPGVALVVDRGAVEGPLFGALTSGKAVLYAPSGALLYEGGLTASRGHEGDSIGTASIEHLVVDGTPGLAAAAPTFGCAMAAP
jgi:hypothetical protein